MRLIKNTSYLEVAMLIVFFLFAFWLYFYNIDKVPAGLYVDEAAPAYNAYSILTTGKDEYGKSFPVLFRSMGLYLTPLYAYLSILPIKFFGLNVFSARIVSAVSGLASALIVFIFLKKLKVVENRYTPLVSTLFFLITPWIVFYSRIGYEISLSFLFISLTALFLWLAFEKSWYLFLALIVGSISIYSGFMPRYLTPLFFIFYFLAFKSEVLAPKNRKYLLSGVLGAFLIQIPHVSVVGTAAFLLKSDLAGISQIASQASKLSSVIVFPLNYVFAFLREFLSNYSGYFSLKSLFFFPDPDLQRSLPDLSVFYPWMLPVFLYGIISFYKLENTRFKKFVLLMLLLFPVPASIAKDPFATHRAIALLLPLTLIIALGIDKLLSKFNFKVVVPAIIIAVLASLVMLWRSYFVLYASERAAVSGFGYAELAQIIKSNPQTHFLIDQSRIKPAYIEIAFHNQFSPSEFQNRIDPHIKENYYSVVKFDDRYSFANLETRTISWEKDIYVDQILVGDRYAVSDGQAKEHFLIKEFEIKDPLGEIVFVGYKTNPNEKCAMTDSKSIYCNR